MDTTQPPWHPCPDIHNLRTIGGYHAPTVRRDYIFRSAAPQRLTAASSLSLFSATGITAVFDLRSTKEIVEHPAMPALDYLPGVTYHHIPVFDESWSPEAMLLRYANYLEGTPVGNYLDILSALPTSLRALLCHIIEHPEKPLLLHCTAGKDRTGVVVALLLSLAGVDDMAVAEEYALTQVAMGEVMETVWGRVRELGVFKKLEENGVEVTDEGIRNMLTTKPETMVELLGRIREEHGGVERWVVEKCGLSLEEVRILREVLTAGDPNPVV